MEPTKNFFRVSHEIVTSRHFKKLTPSAKTLYFYLCQLRNRFQRKKDHFHRSDSQLAKDSGLSERTIQRARQQLTDCRFILFVTQKRKRGKYHIIEWAQIKEAFDYHIKEAEQYYKKQKVVNLREFKKGKESPYRKLYPSK